MLSGNCTEALSIQANVTISAPAQNSLKMALPLSRSLPALLKQYWYIKRGERVRVRGHAPFYATLGFTCIASLRSNLGSLCWSADSRVREFLNLSWPRSAATPRQPNDASQHCPAVIRIPIEARKPSKEGKKRGTAQGNQRKAINRRPPSSAHARKNKSH